ncbi:MAG: TolC family protein [Gemmatimonadales bacterium]
MTVATSGVVRRSGAGWWLRGVPLGPLFWLLLPTALAAQEEAPPGALHLRDALRLARGGNTAIRLATEQTRVAWAGSLQASAPYDLNFTTSFTSVTSRSPVQVPGAVASLPDVSALKQLDYSVGLSKTFRSGLQLSPSVTVQRIDLSTTPGAPVARSTVALNALVPLLRDRAALNLRASGEVADAEVLASEDDRRHATAVALQSVAAAYWTYVGGVRRLAAQQAAEARAQRTVEVTRRLIEADERTPSDLDQVIANATQKTVLRLAAEQALVQARQQLGVAMGLDPGAIATLPLPADSFPMAAGNAAVPRLADWQAQAVAGRRDLSAATTRARATDWLERSAANDLRPRLDLSVGVGYQGIDQGNEADHTLGALFRNVPGLQATVQVRFQQPTSGTLGHARLVQAEATTAQREATLADLRRRILSSVEVAARGLDNARVSVDAAGTAVAMARRGVDHQERKFALGLATLFDVIQAQDALTAAELSEITSQQAFAVAIAQLRLETATLVLDDAPVDLLQAP